MAKLLISQQAKTDMREISDYIRHELRNPDVAVRMIQRFKTTMLPLREFPMMGAPLLPVGKQNVPYRYLICGNYLVFYHTDTKLVYVDRVLYGRRDYMSLLFGDQLSENE